MRLIAVLAIATGVVLGASESAEAHVDNFTFDSWDSTYTLEQHPDGRVDAVVTERITPVFPQHDQNKGIVRSLPNENFNAPSSPHYVDVRDGEGNPVPFSLDSDDIFTYILVGDETYVHGEQTYVLSYTIPDVVAPMDDAKDGGTGVDEFYWDLLPIQRAQPLGSFTATINIADELQQHLTGAADCYSGSSGATEPCDMAFDAATGTLRLSSMEMPPGTGVTVAIAFDPGAVVQPPARVPNWFTDTFPFYLSAAALVIGVIGVALTVRFIARKRRGTGVVIAQYDVPSHLPPLIAGPIAGATKEPIAPQLVHLAVRGALQIEDRGKKPSFTLIDEAKAVDELDRSMLKATLHKHGKPVETESGPVLRFTVPTHSSSFSSEMTRVRSEGSKAAAQRGYFTRGQSQLARWLGIIAFVLAVVSLVFAVAGLMVARESSFPAFVIALIVAISLFVGFFFTVLPQRVYTPAGAETREYLLGVKEFISVAEADRIRMLQSYAGAERESVIGADGRDIQIVKLYEQLLPYAMLFGLERSWIKVLRIRYEETNTVPFWFAGATLGSLSNFDQSMRSVSQSVASAASYSSSSSGGSGGGGFSGGGGGGGAVGGR